MKVQNYTNSVIIIMEKIKKYFPDFSERQYERLEALWPLYREWNEKINVISRKDIEFFNLHHVLHSLSVLKVIDFKSGTKILDLGTGGGFPGIPLAIACPETQFLLVDAIGKKIKVVEDVVRRLGLDNIQAKKARGEDLQGKYDFIVSRAVKPLPEFMSWVRDKISIKNKNELANGVLYLKGGQFEDELSAIPEKHQLFDLSDCFSESYFQSKKIVYIYKK